MLDLFKGLRTRPMTAGHFRSSVWDPFLILGQILAMQCFFYVSIGLWVLLIDSDIAGKLDVSLDQIFSYVEINVLEDSGIGTIIAFVLNSLTCSLGMWYIVQRTKQCLDFSSTMYLLHLIICTVYSRKLPSTFSWWIINVICLTLTTVLSEFLCMRTEMRAIPLNSAPRADL